MRQSAVRHLYRIPVVVTLVDHEKPSLLKARDGAAKRTADVVKVEVRGWIGIQGALGVADPLQILNREAGQGGVLVVIESRAMELVRAALGGHANARNAGILRAEIIGQNIQFAHCFEGRLTGGG